MSNLFEANFESAQPVGNRGQAGKVVWGEDLSLNNRKVDFNLVQPTGMHRSVDQPEILIAAFESIDGTLAAVTAAVVDNPEDPAGAAVGLLAHNLIDQPVKGGDPAFVFATAEDLGAMHVPGGVIGPGAHPSHLADRKSTRLNSSH